MVRYNHSLIVQRYRRDCQDHVVAIRLRHQLSITASICEVLCARRRFGETQLKLIVFGTETST